MRKLLMMLSVLFAVFLAGCGEDLYVDRAFVGTWHWTEIVQYMFVFEADGTGQWGDAQIQTFSWGTRDEVLVLDLGPGFVDIELDFTFDGNKLFLTGETVSFDLFRFVPDHDLVGNWVILEDYMIRKTINADGTGYFMYFLGRPGDELAFYWFNANDMLIRQTGPLDQDAWTYSLNGDVLSLVSRHDNETIQEYRRGLFTQNPALLGVWAWEHDDEWLYYFGADSAGKFGWAEEEIPMNWATFGNNLIKLVDGLYEVWRFAIAGDRLELMSLGVPMERYSYVRVR